ncbi:MAG: hypothetical protein R2824_14340 [Saprospiraceae bacterium]
MTHSKTDLSSYYASFRVILLLLFCSFLMTDLNAQDKIALRLSLAANVGYAPLVTHGSKENSGIVAGFYGELEYGKIIGRLQYTTPLLTTFNEDNNLDGGTAYHGALGYRLDLSDQFFVGLLVSGGATVVQYNNGFNGSSGDTFTNVSPQVGVIIAPAYQISKLLSLQAGLRYYKGFEAGDRGQASDLADISVGIRVSF